VQSYHKLKERDRKYQKAVRERRRAREEELERKYSP